MANLRYDKYQLRVDNPDAISGIDVLDSVQSQYAASPHMLSLLVSKAALADPGKDLMLWYQSVFNPQSAQGVGLDIWGRIVGVPRVLDVALDDWFGFAHTGFQPFGHGPFWSGANAYTTQDLDDTAFRTLIFWKAAANISEATAPALNELLQRLFPGKPCCVLEIRPMHIRVLTRVGFTAVHEAIFRKYGLMAKGAGVGVEWLDVPDDVFGFDGTGLQPFGQGTFFSGGVVDYQPV